MEKNRWWGLFTMECAADLLFTLCIISTSWMQRYTLHTETICFFAHPLFSLAIGALPPPPSSFPAPRICLFLPPAVCILAVIYVLLKDASALQRREREESSLARVFTVSYTADVLLFVFFSSDKGKKECDAFCQFVL